MTLTNKGRRREGSGKKKTVAIRWIDGRKRYGNVWNFPSSFFIHFCKNFGVLFLFLQQLKNVVICCVMWVCWGPSSDAEAILSVSTFKFLEWVCSRKNMDKKKRWILTYGKRNVLLRISSLAWQEYLFFIEKGQRLVKTFFSWDPCHVIPFFMDWYALASSREYYWL